MFKNFTESELNQLIIDQVEEDLHLDYKGADSLQKTDSKKREMSKDVSAFANSDGGTIIYGMREFNDTSRRYLPERIDPIDRTLISKEWIEQVLNSNIQPKVPGLLISPIQLSSSTTHVVYVVTIPKSITAHQSQEKKYYKRYNFESIAMEDYEIKDLINRQSNPFLQLLLSPANATFIEDVIDVITIPVVLMNLSIKMAKDVKTTLEVNEPENFELVSLISLNDLSPLNPGKTIFGSMHDSSIYKGLNIRIGTVSFRLLNKITKLSFTSTIYADNMEPDINNFETEIVGNKVQYNIL